MKLWQKDYDLNSLIESFTVGQDYLLDQELVPFDCLASKAHAQMLGKIGILHATEVTALIKGLDEIMELHARGEFKIEPADEDCHTAIENYLTLKLGELGKKIHTGRSRNDQVLTALRLYYKAQIKLVNSQIEDLIAKLELFIQHYGEITLPGYTHTRKAMPSSVSIWAGNFKSALGDDKVLLHCISQIIDQNPLGSGAGYGIPLNLDRQFTTTELGFGKLQENPLSAQNSRGKFEGMLLHALATILLDLNKMATDLIFFTLPELGFFELPKEFLTGSSIMPHKYNPDVLELMRAKYHEVFACEIQVRNTCANLISGYHRDLQQTKEPTLRGLRLTLETLKVASLLIANLKVDRQRCQAAMTKELYTTAKVYELVQSGLPFREAYRQVSQQIDQPGKKD